MPVRHPRRASSALASLVSLRLTLLLLLSAAASAPLAAQEIHVAGMSGEQLNDAELAKGTAIVIVWASWSPRCRDLPERLQPLAGHWRSRARLLTVDFEEDRPTVAAFLAGHQMDLPVYLDTDGMLSKKYAVATLPGLLVLVDGKVQYHGKLPDDPDRLLTSILH